MINCCYLLPKCYFCPSEDTTYCNMCKNWFCDKCRKRYDKRIIAMIKKKIPNWFPQSEVDEMKRNGTWK